MKYNSFECKNDYNTLSVSAHFSERIVRNQISSGEITEPHWEKLYLGCVLISYLDTPMCFPLTEAKV